MRKDNINLFLNSCIVVAHPDDEIIFSSSLIEYAKKIIVCFSTISEDKKLTLARKKLIENFPLKKIIFLNFEENNKFFKIISKRNSMNSCIVERNSNLNYLLKELNKIEKFKLSKSRLSETISKELYNIDTLITHNPWGEYGHFEHINVHHIVKEIAFQNKKNLYCFGYVANRTFKHFRNSISSSSFGSAITVKTNKKIYIYLEDYYKQNNCWTWFLNYKLTNNDIFFSLKKAHLQKSDSNKKNIFINLLPMNASYTGLVKKSILLDINEKLYNILILNFINFLIFISLPIRFFKKIKKIFKKNS